MRHAVPLHVCPSTMQIDTGGHTQRPLAADVEAIEL